MGPLARCPQTTAHREHSWSMGLCPGVERFTVEIEGEEYIVHKDVAEEFERLQGAATTLGLMHAALVGASATKQAHPAYTVLALSLLEMYGEGTPNERMDKMSDVIAAHRHELW